MRQFTLALIACGAALSAMPGRADVVHADDVIVTRDLCAGSASCVDSEVFTSNIGGADIKIKSSDPQVWFHDTSTTGDFGIEANGNLEISGSLIQASSREIKDNIEAVDELSVLERVVELPIHSWSYIKEPGVTHVGPMAEDFYHSFGLGGTDKGISSVDTGGVALAAIQGLKREKDREVAQLRAEKDRTISDLGAESTALKAGLEERMLQLEMALAEVRRNQSREVKLGSAR